MKGVWEVSTNPTNVFAIKPHIDEEPKEPTHLLESPESTIRYTVGTKTGTIFYPYKKYKITPPDKAIYDSPHGFLPSLILNSIMEQAAKVKPVPTPELKITRYDNLTVHSGPLEDERLLFSVFFRPHA